MEGFLCCGLSLFLIIALMFFEKWTLAFFGILFNSKDLIHEAGNLCEKEIPYKDQHWVADDIPELRAARDEAEKRAVQQHPQKWREWNGGDTIMPNRLWTGGGPEGT